MRNNQNFISEAMLVYDFQWSDKKKVVTFKIRDEMQKSYFRCEYTLEDFEQLVALVLSFQNRLIKELPDYEQIRLERNARN